MLIVVVIAILLFVGLILSLVRPRHTPQHTRIPPQLSTDTPDGYIPRGEYDSVLSRLESTKEEFGRLSASHVDEIAALNASQLNRMREYRAQLNLEFAEKKRTDRQASNARSRTALVAKISEHMAPLLAGFPYNFKEARHLGELVDFIVYDGLEDGQIKNVVFLEVTTKRSGRKSNPNELMLKDAIDNGRVKYQVFVPERIEDADTASTEEEPVDTSRTVERGQHRRTPTARGGATRSASG